jgi:hypothetical protein
MNKTDTQLTDLAVLVHTCDRYEFLYEGFTFFFNKYWDRNNLPCAYYFATEELKIDLQGFTNIRSGKGEWADRLRYLLENVITEKYVIYMQEDMWLNKPTKATFFEQLFQFIQKNNWQQVKLGSSAVYKTVPTSFEIEGFNIAMLDNQASGYLMSHQITVWDREFLIRQLYKGEHPWRNERRGTKRLKKMDPQIFHADYFAENGEPPINTNKPGIVRSEYHTVSANSMLQANVLPYIDELRKEGPQQQAYANRLTEHYEKQLTHDGKPKPRKEDVFKKIKRLFKPRK